MTTAAEDRANEDAFEALLAGRSAPDAAAGLAAFTGAVRGAATAPGRPSAALADLLSTGLLTDQSSPSARTAATAGPERSRRTRRRPTMIPVLVAKFLSAGAVAQAAAGAGVVVVLTAGAGTAGVLPGELQTAYSSFTGTGQTLDDPEGTGGSEPGEDEGGEPGEVVVPPLPSDEDVVAPVEQVEPTDAELAADWAEQGLAVTTQAEFKEWLAQGKAEGWVTGEAVSAAAHARNAARKAETTEQPEVEAPEDAEDGAGEDDAEEPQTEVEADDDAPGGSKGKGGGQGKGRG